MPFIEINGAKLYYEIFGHDHADRVPIVLIHGSTGTGRSNWSLVAPLLAREYRVIVPDCRGHGRSSNPNHSYSFKELAADTAELIRALGYRRAHIIGHSNGGNVVLVALLEHPDVVQTCIPQAANAYVSADLIQKEPPLFDPDRVARESPGWMNEMIALHGETHGKEYWRDLLRMTVQEIITEPNYAADDLLRVGRPVLVIQGADDRVNAPSRHAQFIAQHIPDSELWIPPNVGHNVHDERLFEWIDHVFDFLARRGDDANDTLYRLRRAHYADTRETIFDVRVDRSTLSGRVLSVDQQRAALDALSTQPQDDRVQVLLRDDTPWALVNRSVVDLWREPSTLAERLSQALIGEAIRILEERGDWLHVRLERDGYIGWMQAHVVQRRDEADVQAYQARSTTIVCAELAQAYDASDLMQRSGKLPFGVTLPCVERHDDLIAVHLPDDRVWWIEQRDTIDARMRPRADAIGIDHTLQLIRRSIGVPYLWGGRSPFGYDCSGLAQTFWSYLGVSIPRDADQQFRTGTPIEDTPQAGDLLFFGEPDSDDASHRYAHITHVAISLGGDEMIHANGAARGVSLNSLDPASPIYRAWLREHLAGVRRFDRA